MPSKHGPVMRYPFRGAHGRSAGRDGKAFATGYFEPEIAGCRVRRPGCEVPVYKRPVDLIDVDLGQFSDELKGRNIRGKVNGTKFVQYDDRAAIENGSLSGRGLEIAYAADVVDFFFCKFKGQAGLIFLTEL